MARTYSASNSDWMDSSDWGNRKISAGVAKESSKLSHGNQNVTQRQICFVEGNCEKVASGSEWSLKMTSWIGCKTRCGQRKKGKPMPTNCRVLDSGSIVMCNRISCTAVSCLFKVECGSISCTFLFSMWSHRQAVLILRHCVRELSR